MLNDIPRVATIPSGRQPNLISRFSIALMAFTLMGLGLGSSLPPQVGVLALGAAGVALIGYMTFEALARKRRHETIHSLRAKVERRLVKQLESSRDSEHPSLLSETSLALGNAVMAIHRVRET